MITCRNADVEAVAVKAVEGKPMYGGDMLVKPLIKGDEIHVIRARETYDDLIKGEMIPAFLS